MKLTPAYRLLLLLVVAAAFLTFLLTFNEKEKVCCIEKKPQIQEKSSNYDLEQLNSFRHLIAYTKR